MKRMEWRHCQLFFPAHALGMHCSLTGVDILQEEVRLSFAVDVVLPDSGKCLVVWVKKPNTTKAFIFTPLPNTCKR